MAGKNENPGTCKVSHEQCALAIMCWMDLGIVVPAHIGEKKLTEQIYRCAG